MKINYNKQKLEQIISTLFVLTGISIAVLDTEYNFVCKSTKQNDFCTEMQSSKENRERCRLSDEKLLQRCKDSRCFESHFCHAGLYDAVIPIIKSGIIVGYVIMGRVRASCSQGAMQTDLNSAQRKMYNELPYFNDMQIQSLKTLIEDIIFENAITLDFDETIDKVAEFLKNNITQNYSINELCTMFCISKNYLYSGFSRSFGVTVNEYVINLRIERAKELLLQSALPVYQVGQSIGLDNYTYFCKLFKKRTGLTPKTYRNKNHL